MNSSKPEAIILFDGVCNLCNSSINYVIDHDPDGYFKFGALQSDRGEELLKEHRLESEELKTVILIENERVYTRSTAALRIAGKLKGSIKLAWIFIILPPFIRDSIYRWVARNRYRWFGRRDQCRVPTPELRRRFIG